MYGEVGKEKVRNYGRLENSRVTYFPGYWEGWKPVKEQLQHDMSVLVTLEHA